VIALFGLFFAAFLAATPIPFQSEVVFLGMQAAGWAPLTLILVASVGNVLGSCVTYALGRWLGDLRDHPRFPIKPAQLARAERWYARWGLWSLLISCAPGGDVLVALAGLLRAPFAVFLILVTIAKTARYVAVGWLAAAAFGG
jgi:membrane protein YqaA with SNARE-associated domain